jgi:hypothetical protein
MRLNAARFSARAPRAVPVSDLVRARTAASALVDALAALEAPWSTPESVARARAYARAQLDVIRAAL